MAQKTLHNMDFRCSVTILSYSAKILLSGGGKVEMISGITGRIAVQA
jgi:hypothetical protein